MAPRGDWNPRDLKKALKWILNRKYNVECAAKISGISKATLYRAMQPTLRKLRNDLQKKKPGRRGRKPNRTPKVGIMCIADRLMANEIIRLQKENFVISPKDVKKLCFYYCQDNPMYPNLQEFNFRNKMASDQWYANFMMRHPEIKIKCGNRRIRRRRRRTLVKRVRAPSCVNNDDSEITITGGENGGNEESSLKITGRHSQEA